MLESLGVTTDKKTICSNLKRNSLIAISFFLFVCVYASGSVINLLAEFVAILITATQLSGLKEKVTSTKPGLKVFTFLSTTGICFFGADKLYHTLCSSLNNAPDASVFIKAVVWFVATFPSVFCVLILFYSYLIRKLASMFRKMEKTEYIVYSVILLAFSIYCVLMFSSSRLFYAPADYNFLYSSDSFKLVSENCYLDFVHIDNDIRQPLFAVFSAPFVSIGYLLAVVFSWISPVVFPILINLPQLVMLLAGILLLSSSLGLEKRARILFVAVFSVTYTTLLSVVMMEQYITAFFYVTLVLFDRAENAKTDHVLLAGAGGTLLTSLGLITMTSKASPIKQMKAFLGDMVKSVLVFLYFVLLSGRTNIITDALTGIKNLLFMFGNSADLGRHTGIFERLCQYSHFISDCFIKPDTTVKLTDSSYIFTDGVTWQLSDSHFNTINIVGVILILLCICGFVVSRKDVISRTALGAILFSMLLLIGIGWGSPENGMVLYSLYFCWAFYILLFRLGQFICKHVKWKLAPPILAGIVIIIMGTLNFMALRELFAFASAYYPL